MGPASRPALVFASIGMSDTMTSTSEYKATASSSPFRGDFVDAVLNAHQ